MLNDENQEDVTLENDVEQEEEETVEQETTESEPDWKAEAKKWEAIAKRKAKKADEAVQPQSAPIPMDNELVEITYRNHMATLGLTSQDAQNRAMEYAKNTGQSLTKVTSDPAIMAVLKEADKQAKAKAAIAPGTGGSAVQKNDTSRIAANIAQGKGVKEDDLSGSQALELLGMKR